MSDQAENGRSLIITGSRFRVWWLRRICGYQVERHVQTPQQKFLGQIRYIDHWHLSEKTSAESS